MAHPPALRKGFEGYVEDASIGYMEFENGLRVFIETSQVSPGGPKAGESAFRRKVSSRI